MPTYTWSSNFQPFKNAKDADPNIIGNSLAEIAVANNNILRPSDVWQAAQTRRHPLHPFFEWDTQKAAELHWNATARTLIRSIMILPAKNDDRPQRAWISAANRDGTNYHSVGDVLTEVDLQLAVIKRGLIDLDAWITRFHALESIVGPDVTTARQKLADRLAAGGV